MPIRWRLTLFIALAIGTILLVLGLALSFLLRQALRSELEEMVENRARAAASLIDDVEDVEDLSDNDDIESLALDGVFIVVRDANGGILFQTRDLSGSEATQDPIFRQAIESGQPASGTAELTGDEADYVTAVPVSPEDGPSMVIEAGRSYENVQETLATFQRVLVAGLVVAFLLSILSAYVLSRISLRPVSAVTAAASDITDDDLSKRLPVSHPRDEIGRLTIAINNLLARLESAFSRQEEALSRERQFVADASHELRTPLTSIIGYAKLLESWGVEDPEKARESVTAIRRESERMRDLVERLLALARGDAEIPLDVETADLAAIAADAIERVRAAANGKTTIEYVAPENPVTAVFDPGAIRETISILLENAVQYTPSGGKVVLHVRETDSQLIVDVVDNGIGIPEEHLPHIFERFHRVDPARGGGSAGLGLSIARQIAEAHGGKLEARSEPGRGSIFTLSLPKRPR